MCSLLCKNRAGPALIVASIPQRLGLPKKYIFLCLPAVQCACYLKFRIKMEGGGLKIKEFEVD